MRRLRSMSIVALVVIAMVLVPTLARAEAKGPVLCHEGGRESRGSGRVRNRMAAVSTLTKTAGNWRVRRLT